MKTSSTETVEVDAHQKKAERLERGRNLKKKKLQKIVKNLYM